MTHWADQLLSSPGFCTMPFFHSYIKQDGSANVCCNNHKHVYGNVNELPFSYVMSKNNPKVTEFRQQFINSDQLPDSCKLCKNEVGNIYRQKHINKTKHLLKKFDSIDDLVKNEKLYTYDVRFNNLCNLQCLYCHPTYSSRVSSKMYLQGKEVEIFKSISADSTNDILKTIENSIDNVIEFYFAGGEPLIMKEHYDVLDICLKYNRTDISLAYSSNLTKLGIKNYSLIDYWNKFENVKLNASIDAGWDQFEFIRDGGKWQDVLENCKKVRILKNVKFSVAPVISFWNMIGFPKVYIYLIENNLVDRITNFPALEILNFEFLKPAILPKQYKDRIIETYHSEYKDYPELFRLLNYFDKDLSHLLPLTRNYIHRQKKIKNNDFYAIFPELDGLFDNL